ncbi:MAG: tail fiber protein [Ferruginibacter sp.]
MDPFVAEIRIFGCNFAPVGWAFCNGQILAIAQNTALFSLLGTQYGGNGQTTFALPNLQGSVPLGQGQGPGLTFHTIGEQGGSETVTLIGNEMPTHNHTVKCYSDAGDAPGPVGNVLAGPGADRGLVMYSSNPVPVNMNITALSVVGSGLPHNNMSPILALNYCIALQGVYPSRN